MIDLEAIKERAELASRSPFDHFAHNAPGADVPALIAEVERLRIALADAIRRPMGVVPDSAEGLITTAELDAAESRRPKVGQP